MTTDVENGGDPTQPTPLPKFKLLCLACVFISEAFSVTMLFPFVGFMVADMGYSKLEVGYYAGYIASAYFIAQCLTSMPWGTLADRVGTRPVLLLGLVGNFFAMLAFGFSKSLWWAIMTRGINGLLSGNNGVAKVYLRGVTDQSNQAQGFATMGMTWGLGSIIGPVVSGLLAKPTDQYPSIFVGGGLFEEYPYLLPCAMSSLVNLLGFVFGYFYLTETVEDPESLWDILSCKGDDDYEALDEGEGVPMAVTAAGAGVDESDSDSKGDSKSRSKGSDVPALTLSVNGKRKPREKVSIMHVLTTRAVAMSMGGYFILAVMFIVVDETFALWALTSPKHHGLGFQPRELGICNAVSGAAVIFWQVFVYHRLDARIGPIRILQLGACLCMTTFSLPFVVYVQSVPLRWVCLFVIYILKGFGAVNSFTAVIVIINNSSDKHVGAINGFNTVVGAVGRAIAPVVGGSLLAWSETQTVLPFFPFDYRLIFVIILLMAISLFIIGSNLPADVALRVEVKRATAELEGVGGIGEMGGEFGMGLEDTQLSAHLVESIHDSGDGCGVGGLNGRHASGSESASESGDGGGGGGGSSSEGGLVVNSVSEAADAPLLVSS